MSTWVFDLDGVLWLADHPIPGAASAVASLVESGRRAVFFTNNSNATRAEHRAKLARFGLDVDDADLLTSAEAAAGCCRAGERVLVLGGPGILEALAARAIAGIDASDATDGEGFDAVVAGIDLRLDYRRLARASTAIRAGARFVATNDDATFPSPAGPVPGAGAIVSALATASGSRPIVAGKPNPPAVALATKRLGSVAAVVGDRPETEGLLAKALGARFVLVLSGVTRTGHPPVEPVPAFEAADLAGVAAAVESGDVDF